MEKFAITGGKKLVGEIEIQSAKNSVLPLIAASIIHEGKTYIEKCPEIYDVLVMMKIINSLGGIAYFSGDTLVLDTANINSWELPCSLTREIRASLFAVGALLSRFGYASICMPGGCNIGERPIDIHIDCLKTLGVKVYEGEVVAFKREGREINGRVKLRFPSVGATENAIMAAVIGGGRCVIENAAKEPEIADLQNYLNLAGAKISGAGSGVVTVEGVKSLKKEDLTFRPVADRIEAGTFLLAAASCGGEIRFKNENLPIYLPLKDFFENNACKIYRKNGKIDCVNFNGRIKAFGKVVTDPYPGFPTDLQPQLVAAACTADGLSVVKENVFKARFGYATELVKTGADIETAGNFCVVSGKERIVGANMTAGDLRGGAALVIAALSAEGKSMIGGVYHIDRGYASIEKKFALLGADIKRTDI